MALTAGTKVGLGVVVAAAIGYLVLSDTGEGVLEYMYVDQLMADVSKHENRTLNVHGLVEAGARVLVSILTQEQQSSGRWRGQRGRRQETVSGGQWRWRCRGRR